MEKFTTPIMKMNTDLTGVHLYIKRDDLLPFSFGGNKVRIAQEYFRDMDTKGKNCMIGYGNARSNLCRVLANMNYNRGGICHIISPADPNGQRTYTNNSKLVNACEAIFHTCTKENVAETVQKVLDECQKDGLDPYYIYGDKYGQGNEAVPVRAYEKVYNEIYLQKSGMGIEFDYIFCATGTGMTQAGLIAGRSIKGGTEKIVGISVARSSLDERKVIRKYIDAYFQNISVDLISESEINVIDDYLFGGYGIYGKEIIEIIRDVYKINGIALDPTYTGKAFYGMIDFLQKQKLRPLNVLFIHTGGLPLFFDNIDKIV